jgi:crossover junction endodeoxyribonuclease RuvC
MTDGKVAAGPEEVVRHFVEEVQARTDGAGVYIGIDPGAQGAIGFLCGNSCAVVDIPVIVVSVRRSRAVSAQEQAETGHKTRTVHGSTTMYNFGLICDIFQALEPARSRVVAVGLEEVPRSLGPGRRYAEAVLNRSWGLWPLFLYAKGYAVEDVRPNVWKRSLGLLGKDKEASRLKAMSLFPSAGLMRKKDHGRAEALLLAEYVRRQREKRSC